MQNTADHGSAKSGDRNDCCSSIVLNLGSLVEQVRANMKLIESTIAGEASLGNRETAANIIVLDDVTPRNLRANAALNACNVCLGIALDLLRDVRTSRREVAEAKGEPLLTRCA
jgi:hypothetical protein